MSNYTNKREATRKLTLGAILTAIVIILQFLAVLVNSFKLLPFSLTFVLIPIIIGAAMCGTGVSTWLGFVFGVVVLLSGDAAWFLGFNVPGTIITVLLKGTLCGFITGIVYNALQNHNKKSAIWVSSIVCPIVNTGVFALGCYIFFLDDLMKTVGGGLAETTAYIFLGLCGINFLIEFFINLLLNPAITTVIKSIQNRK